MTALLTPYDKGSAQPAGRRIWRKQLLPVGTIDYKGRKIRFDRQYLTELAAAFRDRAYDQVPFQIAPGDNSHSNDPERFRGEVAALEMTDDGLDVIVAATEDGDALLRSNPHLGVSARIVEDYARADGRNFRIALQHVLGTLDPRITGMRPWQAVEASNEDGEVLDLTDTDYAAPESPTAGKHRKTEPQDTPPADPGTPATEEHDMALTTEQEARLGRLLDLDEDKFTALLAAAETTPEGTEGATEDELSDEELQALIDSLPAEDGPEDEDEGGEDGEPAAEDKVPATAGAAFSSEQQAAIDLANARAEQTELELARVTSALDDAAFEKERGHLSREFGIPPRITDLARPLLRGNGHVVELANGSSVDAGAIMRKVFAEVGKTVKMLDLSGELGTPLDFSAEAEKAAEDAAVAERQGLVNEIVHSGKYGL
jgi:hypothetical protein